MIYFDNGATTFPKPKEVYEALDYANRNYAFNAGRGNYKKSEETFNMIEETRTLLSNFVGTKKDNVIFTTSATEALNIIINGIDFVDGDNVYVTPFEHNAIMRPLHHIQEKIKINIIIIPFDNKTWNLKTNELANLFASNNPRAIFVSHVSNVTGFILPYQEIFNLSRTYESINVLDAAQSFGIVSIDSIEEIDYVVFAGHKSLYASFGVAGFIALSNIKLNITKSGGTGSDTLNNLMPTTLPSKYEAGSTNSVAIAGLNASLKWLKNIDIFTRKKELTNYLIDQIKIIDNVKLFLPDDGSKIFGIVSFHLGGYSPQEVAQILNDEFNICVRSGYHCAPLIHNFIGSEETMGTIRLSLGYFNTKEEVDTLIDAMLSL